MNKPWEDYEPDEEELKEIEKLLQDMEREELEEGTNFELNNRTFYQYESFESFKNWLKSRGIKWE